VARWQVLAVSVLGLAGCVTVFTAYEPWLILPGLAAGGGLATYTFFKRRWWGGPFYNAWIVAVLCLMAFCAAGGSLLPAPPAGFFWTLGLVLFGYALFVLVGYLKDVRADAATGYQTLPVTFGRTVSAWVSDGIAAFALLCYAHAFASAPFVPPEILASLISVLLGIAGVGYLITGQILTHRNRSDEAAHVPITCTVHSYILLLGSLTVTRRPEWSLAVVTFYVFFVLTMRSRPAVSQI
jgi:4-hydroxybenzoate polyprenyltransferase